MNVSNLEDVLYTWSWAVATKVDGLYFVRVREETRKLSKESRAWLVGMTLRM